MKCQSEGKCGLSSSCRSFSMSHRLCGSHRRYPAAVRSIHANNSPYRGIHMQLGMPFSVMQRSAAAAAQSQSCSQQRAVWASSAASAASQASCAQDLPPCSSSAPLQVTSSSFAAALPAVKAALDRCQFFAFDCEMSGLFLQGQEDYAADDVDDRYVKTAAAAEQFLVTQFGLSLFTWTGSGYEARSFNFHLFPKPSDDFDLRFTCQASSLAFLASQGFDFNKMVYEGIHFQPLSLRDRQVKASSDAHRAAATPPPLEDMDEDERCLLQQLQDDISTWLESDPSNNTLYLPAPPPQLLKLQRQLLAAGIGSSRWTSSSSSSSSSKGGGGQERLYLVEQCAPAGPHDISSSSSSSNAGFMLRRATAAALAAAAKCSQAQRVEQANAAAGFSLVFELLRDSQKPAVGHNIRFDLAFALAAFVQNPLPKTWPEYKQLVGRWFPGGIFDTKYLARSLPGSSGVGYLLPDTGLGNVFSLMVAQGNPAQPQPLASSSSSSSTGSSLSRSSAQLSAWLEDRLAHLDKPEAWQTLPAINHAPGCEQYAAVSAAAAAAASLAHEAGYDAFMTGVVFVGLLRLFEIEGLQQCSRWLLPAGPAEPPALQAVQQYSWRQYNSRSKDILYAALKGPELVPQRPNVVYLTGLSAGTRWQEVQRKFNQLGLGRPPVHFVRGNGLSSSVTGAYVILQSAKQASQALQLVRQANWGRVKIMSYSDYFYSKHGQDSSMDGSSSGSGGAGSGAVGAAGAGAAAVRPAPAAVQQLPTAGSSGAGDVAGGSSSNSSSSSSSSSGPAGVVAEMRELAQQLQRKSAAVQRQKQQQAQQEAEQVGADGTKQSQAGQVSAASSSSKGSSISAAADEQQQQQVAEQPGELSELLESKPAAAAAAVSALVSTSNGSSSSSGSGSGSTADAANDSGAVGNAAQQREALLAAGQRLAPLKQQTQGSVLKRPVMLKRPQLP